MDDGTTLGIATDGLRIANAIRLTGSNDPVIDTGAFNATLAGPSVVRAFSPRTAVAPTLAGTNDYTGATNVAAGTLRAGRPTPSARHPFTRWPAAPRWISPVSASVSRD
jgi:hypothetical protein